MEIGNCIRKIRSLRRVEVDILESLRSAEIVGIMLIGEHMQEFRSVNRLFDVLHCFNFLSFVNYEFENS